MNEIRSIKTLREKVYTHLKTMIKARKLSPGEFIDLNQIGDELGMSRSPFHLTYGLSGTSSKWFAC
jgi:DNA-binding GntR family transcriptional regulator